MTDRRLEPPVLPARPADGHKGTFGTVGVIGGQAAPPVVMIGGAAMTALAALRVGAGLAKLAAPQPVLLAGLAAALPVTGLALPVDNAGRLLASRAAAIIDDHLNDADCLAIGPAWGAGEAQQQILERLISRDETPMVLDADALNTLAQMREFSRGLHAPVVLTPHPGEYRRLVANLGLDDVDPTDPERREHAAVQLAQRVGAVVVLKGAGTIVTDGLRVFVSSSGNAALATGGSGDVLTGMIAGLIAQFAPSGLEQLAASRRPGGGSVPGRLDLFECAAAAVHLHGVAADLWAESHGDAGLLATDLLERIPEARRVCAPAGRDRG